MLFNSAFTALLLCGSAIATDFTALKAVSVPVSRPRVAAPRALALPRAGGLRARQTDTCFSGDSCADCFGSGYIECSNDDSMCYDPSTQDEDFACDSSGSSSPSPSPSSTPGGTDTCFDGSSCSDCFGSGYIECPNDDYMCYDPDTQDVDFACETSSGSDSSGSSGTPTSSFPSETSSSFPSQTSDTCYSGTSCEDCFGDGYITCPGSDSDCYNPDEGSVSANCPSPTSTGAAARLGEGHQSLLASVLGAFGLMMAAM